MLSLSRVNGADNHYFNIAVDPDNNDVIYSSTGANSGNHRFFVGSSPSETLHVVGGARITNLVSCGGIQTNASGVMSCTSDENLKNLGSVYSSGLESIRKIAPQSYSWKEGTPMYDGGILYHGFIAQNIQEALPEAVNVGASGQLQINTTTILASSINAIKDLDLSVQSIESRITALENASSTNDESSSSSLFDSFWQMLADRMASLANGIGDFFANRVRTKELCIMDDTGETCITKAALDALLANAGQGGSSGSGDNGDGGGEDNGGDDGAQGDGGDGDDGSEGDGAGGGGDGGGTEGGGDNTGGGDENGGGA